MAAPKLESRNAANLAYIAHVGPYDELPWEESIQRLYNWAKTQKVMPGFYPMALYHGDPETTPPESRRTEIAITFKGRAKEEGDVHIRKLPAMRVATVSHHAPASEFTATYEKLKDWISKKNYEISGPPIEVYSKRPEVVGDVTVLHAKIMMPVEKKGR